MFTCVRDAEGLQDELDAFLRSRIDQRRVLSPAQRFLCKPEPHRLRQRTTALLIYKCLASILYVKDTVLHDSTINAPPKTSRTKYCRTRVTEL